MNFYFSRKHIDYTKEWYSNSWTLIEYISNKLLISTGTTQSYFRNQWNSYTLAQKKVWNRTQQTIIYAQNSQYQLDFLIYDIATLDTMCADATRGKKRCKIKKTKKDRWKSIESVSGASEAISTVLSNRWCSPLLTDRLTASFSFIYSARLIVVRAQCEQLVVCART